LNLENVSSKSGWSINSLPGLDLELSKLPIGVDFLVKFLLKSELLVSLIADILDIFLHWKKRS